MNKIKIGKILITIGAVVWIIENFYFGWNKLPMSKAEETWDVIVNVFMYLGFFIYFLPIKSLYENAVKRHDSSNKY